MRESSQGQGSRMKHWSRLQLAMPRYCFAGWYSWVRVYRSRVRTALSLRSGEPAETLVPPTVGHAPILLRGLVLLG